MRRAAAFALGLAVAAGASACQSTQELSAQRAKNVKDLVNEKGLSVKRVNPAVKVSEAAVLRDANGVAAVLELRNKGAKDEADLPIAISLDDKAGKPIYRNDLAGLERSLTQVALLRKGETGIWVDNQIPALAIRQPKVTARVGVGQAGVPAKLPRFSITKVKADRDSSGQLVRGYIANRSTVAQKRLVISCVARKNGKLVAAGRAIVDNLAPRGAKPQLFRIFFIGNPTGAKLTLFAPPTVLR